MSSMQQAKSKPETSPEERFGAAVNHFRLRRGWSQRDLADKLTRLGMPVDASAVSRIEKGTRSVRLTEAMTLADALDVELDSLVFGSRTPAQEFKGLRREADRSMRSLLENAIEFLETFQEAKWYLEEHPDLLPQLEDETDKPPTSVDGYFHWVSRRLERVRSKAILDARDEAEARALNELLTGFISGIAVVPDANEDDGGRANGIHSEEA